MPRARATKAPPRRLTRTSRPPSVVLMCVFCLCCANRCLANESRMKKPLAYMNEYFAYMMEKSNTTCAMKTTIL